MKKGASYVVMIVLIAAVLLLLYSSGPRFTGYAILPEYENQTSCEDAEYVWEILTEENCTTVTTCLNETVDCEPCLEYEDINGTQGDCIDWSSCIEENCIDEDECEDVIIGGQCVETDCGSDFLELCLDDTNCTNAGGYWYNGVCNEEAELITVTINEPSGTKDVDSGIPLEFTITGAENLSISCLYNLRAVSDDTIVITNTSLTGCSSSSLDVPNEGEYVLSLYVNSPEGLFSDDSSFTVSLPTETEETSESTEEEESSSVQVPLVPSFRLGAAELSDISLAAGSSQEITWSVSSTGRSAVSACSVKPFGDLASWIVASGDTLNINAGEEGVFAFNVFVPEETAEGSYPLGVSVECAEPPAAVLKSFNVEVSASVGTSGETGTGASVGGFAIFSGVGAGEAIIFVVVLFVLVFVFVFARRMRKSGKTLRDVVGNLKLKFKRQ